MKRKKEKEKEKENEKENERKINAVWLKGFFHFLTTRRRT